MEKHNKNSCADNCETTCMIRSGILILHGMLCSGVRFSWGGPPVDRPEEPLKGNQRLCVSGITLTDRATAAAAKSLDKQGRGRREPPAEDRLGTNRLQSLSDCG